MRRLATSALLAISALSVAAGPALACGGLVAPNGAVNLVRTTTLAAYHDGVEHYVTSFEFRGGGAKFGSIVPLPGVPTKVTRGGDWTLQRLEQEVQPAVPEALTFAAAPVNDSVQIVLEKEIDGLKITVLKGGAVAVGNWARANGFNLSPDAPEMLDFYARRSPVFMAVRFDPKDAAANDLAVGDGIPIHVRIPTSNPWVPLRILGLGKPAQEQIDADVFLLTDRKPAMFPTPLESDEGHGLLLERSEQANDLLMSDLRSDKGMKWMPKSGMWLSYLRVNERAGFLKYDLAVDASGNDAPSLVDAGYFGSSLGPIDPSNTAPRIAWLLFPIAALGAIASLNRVLGRIK